MMDFRIVPGAPFGPEDANIIGRRLTELAGQGLLRPEDVVDDARAAHSSLHDYFCWDDELAAERFRREQARKMINSIEIIPAKKTEPVRYFHYVRREQDSLVEHGFATLDVIQETSAFLDQIIEGARKELIGWRRRYRQYQELSREVAAVEQALQIAEPIAE